MTKKEWQIRERGLTLFSTGRFSSRSEAEKEARLQIKRESHKGDKAEESPKITDPTL